MNQMTGVGNTQIRCRIISFSHRAHLARGSYPIAGLDEQRRRPYGPPLRPVVTGAPFGGDLDPSCGAPV